MYELIKLLFDISLFRKGPADVPHSRVLQKILIAGFALIRFIMLNMTHDWIEALYQVGFETAYVLAFCWLLLYFDRKPERFNQVSSAFFGIYALIAFVSLPAVATAGIGRGGVFVFLIMLVINGWFCAATAHVIYHTLDQRLGLSIGVGLLFLIGSNLILDLFNSILAGFN